MRWIIVEKIVQQHNLQPGTGWIHIENVGIFPIFKRKNGTRNLHPNLSSICNRCEIS